MLTCGDLQVSKVSCLQLLFRNRSTSLKMPKPKSLATAGSTQKSTTSASQSGPQSPILTMARPTWSRQTKPTSSLQLGSEQTKAPPIFQPGPGKQGVLDLFAELAAKEAAKGEWARVVILLELIAETCRRTQVHSSLRVSQRPSPTQRCRRSSSPSRSLNTLTRMGGSRVSAGDATRGALLM